MVTENAYKGVTHLHFQLAAEPNEATGKLTDTETGPPPSGHKWDYSQVYNKSQSNPNLFISIFIANMSLLKTSVTTKQ